MLTARALTARFGDRQVLDGIDLDLVPGTVTGLLGPNGAGKSTLMRAIAGALPHAGEIELDGVPLAAMATRERARRIAYLPQSRLLAWPLSVENLVRLGRAPWQGIGRSMSAQDRQAVADAMERMDVAHLARRPATELSGGELARVLAARAIAQDTPVLIADEPVAGLDPAHQIAMMAALHALAAAGKTIFVSLHDLTLAARWCDCVILIKSGRIYRTGDPGAVLDAPALRDVFGVKAHIVRDADGMVLATTGLADIDIRGTADM